MNGLTRKQDMFVKEFVKTGHKSNSAKKAYKVKNQSTAAVIANENLKKPNIIEAIESIADQIKDEDLVKIHKDLLSSRKLDHMTFPLGPKDVENEPQANLAPEIKTIMEAQQELERTKLTDKDIEQLLNDANCVLRKIVHGTNARHVYFWSPDNMARDKALDKAYKLKGTYAPEKAINVNINKDDGLSDEEREKLRALLK